MAIVALLLTIALPRYFGSLEKSKEVALQENLRVLRVSLDRFYSDKGRFPDVLDELVEQHYLKAVPVDPVTESSTTWILIPSKDTEIHGIVDIKSGAIGQARSGKSYELF
ncbi:MAG: putative secretion system protein GspG-like 2 [Rhodocyclales bacterium]|nr:putative secretion system protein GspG-like 2 [Rhodocyclales bacterium]